MLAAKSVCSICKAFYAASPRRGGEEAKGCKKGSPVQLDCGSTSVTHRRGVAWTSGVRKLVDNPTASRPHCNRRCSHSQPMWHLPSSPYRHGVAWLCPQTGRSAHRPVAAAMRQKETAALERCGYLFIYYSASAAWQHSQPSHEGSLG